MEHKVQEHDDTIKNEILPRLERVEGNQETTKQKVEETLEENRLNRERMKALEKQLMDVQMGQKDLANTVLRSGQTSTELQMQSQNMINQLLGLVGSKNESETTVKIKKLDTREKIVVGVLSGIFGAGGLAGVILALQSLF